jgi:AraC-like DNA-binding protein
MREQAKFWHVSEFDHLELLRATYITHTFARHIHETYAVGVIEDGIEGFYYRHENHLAAKGRVVMINPGEIHTGHAGQRGGWWQYRMFYPGVRLMQQIARELSGKNIDYIPYFNIAVIDDDETAMLLRQAHIALENSTSILEKSVLLRLAFGQLLARYTYNRLEYARARDEQHSVRLAREYLELHFQENVALETLAQVAGLSPFHLTRIFQKQVGLPPHAYLTHLRVQHARRLLPLGMPLVDVALASGFADQSHFTRWFKRIIGVTPGQYVAHLAS